MSPRASTTSSFLHSPWLTVVVALALVALVTGMGRAMLRDRAEHEAARARFDSLVPRQERPQTDYVSSQRCAACHPGEHASWHRTYHRTMTQEATPGKVVGRFDGSEIISQGLRYRVFQRGDTYWAEMPNPDLMMYIVQGGRKVDQFRYQVKRSPKSPVEIVDLRQIPRVERQVVMTTGSHHYQTYWVPGDPKFGNLLQTMPLVYLIGDDRWIPREEAFMYPPQSTHMVTQWNHHCIRCHSTGGNPAIDPATGQFKTEVGELGISCEACHGPGEAHERANRDPLRRYLLHLSGKPDPTIVNPARLDHVASSQVCGQCHGVYVMRDEFGMKYATDGPLYKPGEDLLKTRYYIQHPNVEKTPARVSDIEKNPEFFRERWWEDGTILAGGREFTAMSASACYQRGQMSCLSCHSMHGSEPADQVTPGMAGDAACTQCHKEPQYTTEVQRHTHHAAGSTGSECMNCHMPHTTYALFGALRSHQIVVPTAAASIQHGTPNACNLCHLDQTLDWTQQHLSDWYGHEKRELSEEQRTVSAALLWLTKGDAAQRVIAVWHFGWSPAQEASGRQWLAPFAARLLADPYGVVRYVAAGALRTLPGMDTIRYDFLADSAEWKRAVADVTQRWLAEGGRQKETAVPPEAASEPPPVSPPERAEHPAETRGQILFDAEGRLDLDRLEQLIRQRNDRPVTIKE